MGISSFCCQQEIIYYNFLLPNMINQTSSFFIIVSTFKLPKWSLFGLYVLIIFTEYITIFAQVMLMKHAGI